MIKYFFIFLMLTGSKLLYAQNDSTARPADTVRTAVEVPRAPVPKKHLRVRKDTSILVAHRKDSLSKAFRDSLPKFSVTAVRSDTFIYTQHPFFSFTNPLHFSVTIKQWQGKEIIFYSLIALLIFFALIKNSSSRYMNELFQTYFRTTVRQRHIKDQLLQSPIASLMLNIFFLLSTGMFLALLIHSLGYGTQFNFWILF